MSCTLAHRSDDVHGAARPASNQLEQHTSQQHADPRRKLRSWLFLPAVATEDTVQQRRSAWEDARWQSTIAMRWCRKCNRWRRCQTGPVATSYATEQNSAAGFALRPSQPQRSRLVQTDHFGALSSLPPAAIQINDPKRHNNALADSKVPSLAFTHYAPGREAA